uniref:Alpha-1,3-glucosyltransferase n=1 Tax=Phallusia mammillata TaxID=59560 RepID=A0A6F9D6W6_9ASCI|nr:dolichyl pyrophosphate Man9GlcNAc2 alpha-1,3-glucosyltransferase-like [Phallusia mammillata]
MKRLQVLLMQGTGAVFIHLIGSILVRWCVGLGPYSGKGTPPMFGDYEAQRHWQEITLNLPVQEWYTNSSMNDMLYWGLDYPPLTAYHSWLCGFIAFYIEPDWVKLPTSRGTESSQHKLFMRSTVLLVDILMFFPAVFVLRLAQMRNNGKGNFLYTTSTLLTLFYPGLILIDHGHFQYNNFSLGLMIWSITAFRCERNLLGSVAFSLALNYKQMELYHALPVFFYLLGKSMKNSWSTCLKKIVELGLTVLISFAILWAPFLSDVESASTVFQRLFPLNRGLYEDKVASFWCSVAPILKIKEMFEQQAIVRLCALTTLFFSLPSSLHLLCNPSFRNFKLSLVNVSLIFFLFSYQVHEKSILIPAVSACLLYDEIPGFFISWFLYLTSFSMSPLLMKDGLTLQLFATSMIFLVLSYMCHGFSIKSIMMVSRNIGLTNKFMKRVFDNLVIKVFWLSVICSAALVVLMNVLKPPGRYPDIFPVMISTLSCTSFLLFLGVFHCFQFGNVDEDKKTN